MQTAWMIVGFTGQAFFFSRFLVQWIATERRGESFIPEAFWYLSIGGALMLLAYAIHRGDPVFVAGQSIGSVVYLRNLMLIHRRRRNAA